jgi:hypothetical protein
MPAKNDNELYMLNKIRTPEAVALESPAALLLGCHERIRPFTRMAVRLADNPAFPAIERLLSADERQQIETEMQARRAKVSEG